MTKKKPRYESRVFDGRISAASFNHLVGAGKQHGWDFEAE